MREVLWSLCLTAWLLALPAYAGTISGTYTGKGPNAAFMMQLVEGNNRNLTGRYVHTKLTPSSGAIEQLNASIAGAYDGQTIVMTIKPAELLAGSITASGSVDGVSIHLTGGGSAGTLNLELRKSDESEFQMAVNELKDRSRQIMTAKAEADFLTRIQKTTSKAKDLSIKAQTTDNSLHEMSIEQRYRQVTEWMRTAHARQRAIFGDGQASVARGQIDVAVNQAANQAEQIHSRVEDTQRSIHSEVEALGRENADALQKCSSIVAGSITPPSSEAKQACAILSGSVDTLMSRLKALDVLFAGAERVWKEERQKQEQILRASDSAVQ